MTNNKILYEHIANSCEFTDDQDWKDMIRSCSQNKWPKGMSYNNVKGVLYVRADYQTRRTEMFTLPTDPKLCFEMLMHIFKNILKLRSDNDIISSRIDIENARKNNEIDFDCEWKKLKPRSVKTQILMTYAIDQVKSRNLDMKQVNILYRLIQLGIQFKQVSAEDINYKNGVILSIKGVEYSSDTKNFILTNKQGYISGNNNKIVHDRFEKSMDKWMKNYRTYY